MTDLVLDTGPLADLLAQYFDAEDRNVPEFSGNRFLSREIARQINRIVRSDGRYVVTASTFAFVEVVRKWDEIVEGRFRPEQLAAFLDDPPDWFSVEPLDEDLIPSFGQVQWQVLDSNGSLRTLEWPDVVHLATVASRESARLVSSDRELQIATGES